MKNILNDMGLDMTDPETVEKVRDAFYAYSFINAIRNARLAKGLTIGDVEELLGISDQNIYQLETPGADPQLSVLRRYAHAVGVMMRYDVSLIPEAKEVKDGGD